MKKILTILLCCVCFPSVGNTQSTGEILTFPANPQKGFHWGYALYLPQNLDTSKKLPILFIMNNSGRADTVEEAEEKALKHLRSWEHEFADELGVPLLMPLVQRQYRGDPPLYSHELNRAVFVSQEESFKRLDLQVLRMLQDARKQLKKRAIRTQKKMLVTGFSAAGAFCWRWTMLHPDRVIAAACGGDHYPMLPVEILNDTNLIYPVGVYDFKQYTGKKFNKKAWLKIPILSTNGEMDFNDPLPYKECFAPEVERPVLQQVLTEQDVQGRMRHSQRLLNELAPNVQTYLYPNVDHASVHEDMVAFLKQHFRGGPLRPIALKDTSDWKLALPGHVSKLYFGLKAPVPDTVYLEEFDLILQSTPVPRGINGCEIDILHEGKKVVTVLQKHCTGWLGRSRKGSSFIQIHLSDEQVTKLKSYKNRTFSVRSHHPEILDIPQNLTFSIH